MWRWKRLVAKSYQGLQIVKDEFKVNGKSYVVVKTKLGTLKQVRWYSDSEYAKMYPEEVKVNKTKDPFWRTQKDVLGFEKGYIYVYKCYDLDHEWFNKNAVCRFARHFGWYSRSTDEVPADIPAGYQAIKLLWEQVGNSDENLKSEAEIVKVIKSLSAAPRSSAPFVPQGSIGERLERHLKIIGKHTDTNPRYNRNTYTYEFEDADGNLYKWKTQAKDWSVGATYHLRGSVKEYENEEFTVLTRCMEIK